MWCWREWLHVAHMAVHDAMDGSHIFGSPQQICFGLPSALRFRITILPILICQQISGVCLQSPHFGCTHTLWVHRVHALQQLPQRAKGLLELSTLAGR